MCEIGNLALGSIGAYSLTFSVNPDGTLTMPYPSTGVCQGEIIFTCDETVEIGTPVLASISGRCYYHLTWKTKQACPIRAGGLSIGSILCIFFFVSVILYLAIGMGIKYKRYDARGMDMIPNVDFWRDVPFLVKDGFRFVYGKCTKRS